MGLGLRVPDHGLGHLVADQIAFGHDPADLSPELGVVLHVPAEDVPDADVHEIEVAREQLALRALAAALHPHDHVFAHGTTLAQLTRRVNRVGHLPAGKPSRRSQARRVRRLSSAASTGQSWASRPAFMYRTRSLRWPLPIRMLYRASRDPASATSNSRAPYQLRWTGSTTTPLRGPRRSASAAGSRAATPSRRGQVVLAAVISRLSSVMTCCRAL